MSLSDRQRRIEELLARYRQLLEERLPQGPQTMDQIETTVEEIGQQIQRELQEQILEEQQEGPRENRAACPGCGQLARYRATYRRQWVTLHGDVVLHRPYYYCRSCRKGFAPLDLTLGLDRKRTTTAVRIRAVRLAALLPFAPAARELAFLCAIRLGQKTVQSLAENAGAHLLAARRDAVSAHQAGRLPALAARRPSCFYVAADGVYLPVGKEWREAKVGVVGETRVAATEARLEQQNYLATLENSAAFGPQLATLAHQQGYHRAKRQVFLGDGAPWVWHLAAGQFPEATPILDFYHVSEHLAACATAMFGEGSPGAQEWRRARQKELLANRLKATLGALGAWKPATKEEQELQRRTLDYFTANAERMRYQTYQRQGLRIGSGMVEGACKSVVGARFKQAGMRWSEPVVEPLLALRAAVLSHSPPDLANCCRFPA